MTDKTILFIPCYVDGLPASSASVRFRARWPAKYMPEADVYPDMAIPLAEYEAYVFQKAYLTAGPRAMIRGMRARDKLLAFDMCDADWMGSAEHEWRLLDVLPLFDFAVATTEPVRDYLARWVPTHLIPDRLDLASITARHDPRDRARRLRLVWFGYSHNLTELDHIWSDLLPVLDAHDMTLTILSNELPEEWAPRWWGDGRTPLFVEWTEEGANAVIARHDIALVPQRSPYKSNNRMLQAWALGVAPARNVEELVELIDEGNRRQWVGMGERMVRETYDVRRSAQDWRMIIAAEQARKAGNVPLGPSLLDDDSD